MEKLSHKISGEGAVNKNHREKLLDFYAAGGDDRYIFHPEDAPDLGVQEDEVLRSVALNPRAREMERGLLLRIASPIHTKGQGAVFENLRDDKHQKRILATLAGAGFERYAETAANDIANFITKYPTPMDFENDARRFLGMIEEANSENKYQEYVGAMERFQRNIYGKRYDYYQEMKKIHEEAEGLLREEFGRRGGRVHEIFKDAGETGEDLKFKVGFASVNKGELIGKPERANEDAEYMDTENGLFAVFDGAGGVQGGARASSLAAQTLQGLVNDEKVPRSQEDLKNCLEMVNQKLVDDPVAGVSTAVLGKFVQEGAEKKLLFASVGDSRIYIVREGRTILITKDEGEGRYIYNALGDAGCRVKQLGEARVVKGDRVVFCSDGITGDYAKDFIPDDEFARIVGGAANVNEAAFKLSRRATKTDDRTAVVVEVA